MAQNPLLGNRISLISKKNIRYEGTLYSINEANATVALQNVRSYGTEGREKLDPSTTYVAPQDLVHAYLLFRGCDIKDLHVHEAAASTTPAPAPNNEDGSAGAPVPPPPPQPSQSQPTPPQQQQQPTQQQTSNPEQKSATGAPPAPGHAATSSSANNNKNNNNDRPDNTSADPSKGTTTSKAAPPATNQQQGKQPSAPDSSTQLSTKTGKDAGNNRKDTKENQDTQRPSKPQQSGRGGGGGPNNGAIGPNNRRPRKHNPAHQIGTGASLLNRKARGTVDNGPIQTPAADFDFQSNLANFNKEDDEDVNDDEAGDTVEISSGNPGAYEKDDFFDSISCDALDRQQGIDNRLRGAAERNLNTETFGAVALNSRRRKGGRGRGGRGRGFGGRSAGRFGGRGRGRGGRGRGRGGRDSNSWHRGGPSPMHSNAATAAS